MSPRQQSPLQERLYTIVFGTDTSSGKWFDILLIWAILVSVAVIVMDSMASIHATWGTALKYAEWGFTAWSGCSDTCGYATVLKVIANHANYSFPKWHTDAGGATAIDAGLENMHDCQVQYPSPSTSFSPSS